MGDLSEYQSTENGQIVVRPFSAYNLKKNDTLSAEQNSSYISRRTTDLKTPYMHEKLVGSADVWNQLANVTSGFSVSDVTATLSNGVLSLSGRASNLIIQYVCTNVNLIAGHKYILRGCPSGGTVDSYRLDVRIGSAAEESLIDYGNGVIGISSESSTTAKIAVRIASGTNCNRLKFTPQLTDLTALFGPQIADYLYSLEQTTPGSGITKLKEWGYLNKEYYAYTQNVLQVVLPSAKLITGFNLWDEEWELGSINSSTGQNSDSSSNIRSKNFIEVTLGETYFINRGNKPITIYCYDENKNYIESSSIVLFINTTLTIRDNTRYIRFSSQSSTYSNNICINFSDPVKNGTYKPHHKTTIPFPSNLKLRGVKKLDANSNIVYDGDIYDPSGVITRKYGWVDLGTIAYTTAGSTVGANGMIAFMGSGLNIKIPSETTDICNIMTPKYVTVARNGQVTGQISVNTSGNIIVCDTSLVGTSLTDMPTIFSGQYLVYEKATPTTETTDPFIDPQYLFEDGWEEFVDTRDCPVPVGSIATYVEATSDSRFFMPPTPDGAGKFDMVYDSEVGGEMWERHTVVDSELSETSSNPIQNKVVKAALDTKVDKDGSKVLSTNDYTTADKEKVASVSTGATKVEASSTNGNIKIGGAETTVYDDSHTKAESLSMMEQVLATDKTPFLFRQALSILNASPYVREKLVGGSAVHNQLVKAMNATNFTVYGSSFCSCTFADGVITVTVNTAMSSGAYRQGIKTEDSAKVDLISGHKYFFSYCVNPSVQSTFCDEVFRNTSQHTVSCPANTWTRISVVETLSADKLSGLLIYPSNLLSVNDTYKIKELMLIDLTQEFGTTIADHIYSLEQSTAGSGIAWLKSYGYLTKPYYAYNAGGIESVCAGSKVVTGFNQWDEVWEVGRINTTSGENQDSTDRIRSKNYIRVIPGLTYFFKTIPNDGFWVYRYYINKNFTGWRRVRIDNGNTWTVPNDTAYIRFEAFTTYGTTYNHDICINLSDTSRNGQYESYHQTIILLGGDTLRGVPKIDGNGNMYYDGDVKTPDGVIQRKYNEVDMGDLTWVRNTYSGVSYFSSSITGCIKPTYESGKMPICSAYVSTAARGIAELVDKAICYKIDGYGVYVRDDSISDVATFTTAMTGKKIVFELATPTTEQSTPFTDPQYIFAGGTEEFTDGQTRDMTVPVGHETQYMGASTQIKDKFYLPSLPQDDGEYDLRCSVQNGVVNGVKWSRAQQHNYSSEEQIIGTWIDGKTLYEKTLKFEHDTSWDGTRTSIAHGISNIDTCVEIIGRFISRSNKSVCVGDITRTSSDAYTSGSQFHGALALDACTFDKTNIAIIMGDAYYAYGTTYDLVATLRYTKST